MGKRLNQKGVVSLLTASIISTLFLIITLAMVKVMAGELRAASDSQNSIAALYAADSAAEDRILAIKNAITSGTLASLNTDCGSPAIAYGLQVNSRVSCTSFNPTSATDFNDGEIQQDGSLVYFIPQNVSTFEIDWDETDAAGKTALTNVILGYVGTGVTGPPPLAATIINYPAGNPQAAEFRRADIYGTASAGPASLDINVLGTLPVAGTASLSNVFPRTCLNDNTVPYRCRIRLTNFKTAGYKSVIRLSPRFKSAKIHIQTDQPVFGQTATLDITAQVGASYRRVLQQININSAPFTAVGDVIRGDEEVCKEIEQFQAPGYNGLDPSSGCYNGFN